MEQTTVRIAVKAPGKANCPECDAELNVPEGTETGEILPCCDCGIELEVRSSAPVSLTLAPPVEEDWGE